MVPEVVTLAPGFVVARLAKGSSQLAERHGGPYARDAAIDDMRRFVEAGITLFDCADHYVGVEQLIGEFRLRHPDHARRLRVSTKLVPDLESLPRLRRRDVQQIVDTSLARLGQERLDLVQFHWWDYRVPGYVEAMHWLDDLKSAGKVELIGITNFDTARLSEIVASGVSVATNQLQYSVLDHRPEHGRAARRLLRAGAGRGRPAQRDHVEEPERRRRAGRRKGEPMSQTVNDAFELYDLRVEVIETGKPFVMHAKPGDTFDVIGGRLVFPPGREASFSLYAMLAVLPFIPAKQRPTHPNDWMTTDTEIASPDPHCGARLRITRLRKRQLRHADYSAVPL